MVILFPCLRVDKTKCVIAVEVTQNGIIMKTLTVYHYDL